MIVALVFALLYTCIFIILCVTMWVDFTDRFLWVESLVAHGSMVILNTAFAPVTLTPLWGTSWALPTCFMFGFLLAMNVLHMRSKFKKKHERTVEAENG